MRFGWLLLVLAQIFPMAGGPDGTRGFPLRVSSLNTGLPLELQPWVEIKLGRAYWSKYGANFVFTQCSSIQTLWY